MFTLRRLETDETRRLKPASTPTLSENAKRHSRNQENRDNPVTTGPAESLFVN
jgi:hypothetical protein